MDIKTARQIPRSTLERLLSAVPFFNTVKAEDAWQFEVLLQHSRLVTLAPGEMLLARGAGDAWLYFLLKGQLAVYPGDPGSAVAAINTITPGEVVGDLAALQGAGRTATVAAPADGKQVVAIGTDFTVFGELEDTRVISLPTKLAHYRNTVHSLRWKLEVYRMQYPRCVLAGRHRQVRLFTGAKDTPEELLGLHSQALSLSGLLLAWNRELAGGNAQLSERPPVALAASCK